jgi:hypothetical protein
LVAGQLKNVDGTVHAGLDGVDRMPLVVDG